MRTSNIKCRFAPSIIEATWERESQRLLKYSRFLFLGMGFAYLCMNFPLLIFYFFWIFLLGFFFDSESLGVLLVALFFPLVL